MAFSNLTFLLVFLPVSLILYYIAPKFLKNLVLVALGLVFFAWGRPEYVILLLCSALFTYLSALQMERLWNEEKPILVRAVLISAVVFDLLLLCFYKYAAFAVGNLNSLLGTTITIPSLPLPIGISFYTFSLLSYLFDVYYGKAPALKNIVRYGVYVTFFPKLVSGPIVQYNQMYDQLTDRTVTLEGFGSGVRMFIIGLGKKVLLSNVIGMTFYGIFDLPTASLSAVGAWLGAISYSLMLYFDFSGYSDMAIGLAKMFGFNFAPNFMYPYTSNSVSDFWRRWHISLGAWFRDYVYIPCGGSRVSTLKLIRNLLIVWALTGIWHGASWTFVVWGLYYGAILILEKIVFKPILDTIPNVLRRLLTLILVVVGWVFFFSESISQAKVWLSRMFFVGPMIDANASYYLWGCLPLLIVGIFASTQMGANIGNQLFRKHNQKKVMIASILFYGAIILLSIAGMTNDTYSTFLYTQF